MQEVYWNMSKVWLRLWRVSLVCIPVLLASSLFIQNSAALSPKAQHSHEDVTESILYYNTAQQVANAVVANPFLALPLEQASSVGQWSSVKQWPLVAIHAAMLKDGRIIMWDRENEGTTSMRLYNPTTDSFTKIADP